MASQEGESSLSITYIAAEANIVRIIPPRGNHEKKSPTKQNLKEHSHRNLISNTTIDIKKEISLSNECMDITCNRRSKEDGYQNPKPVFLKH
jgi:hypothetical protein